jgi:hypothetical protein
MSVYKNYGLQCNLTKLKAGRQKATKKKKNTKDPKLDKNSKKVATKRLYHGKYFHLD